jgi:hypothetical protein
MSGLFRGDVSFSIDYKMSMVDEAMSLVFPLGPNRASIVTKMGGVAVYDASVQLGEKQLLFKENMLGMMDWTRGLLRRVTYWHWSAMSFLEMNGRRIGLQLSEGTYDNAKNVSVESTLWVDGQAHHVNSRIIYTQLDKSVAPQNSLWSVTSLDRTVDLLFQPSDVIQGAFHYGIIDGDLFHIWGTYNGRIFHSDESIIFRNVPGTLEDHYAMW